MDLSPAEESCFVRVVKTAFGQRRKMLRKGLLGLGTGIKEYLPRIFEHSEVSPDARPESLTVEDFCRISKEICRVLEMD